jgi:hypothetical protein
VGGPRLGLVISLAALVAFPSSAGAREAPSWPRAGIARSDGAWRSILVEAGGLWWQEYSNYCHLNQFRRVSGSRQFDGRVARNQYFRNPFSRQCLLRTGYVPVGHAGSVWAVRRGVLRMYFVYTGRVAVDTVRLISYSSSSDVLTLSRGGVRQLWYGCDSRFNPFPCV